MSAENLDGIYSYPASADLRTNQWQVVVVNGSGQVALAGANALAPDGPLHNAPNLGEMGRVVHLRGVIAKVKAGAAFALNALLTTDATGRLVTATTGQNVCAKANRAAGAAGDIVEVRWYGYNGVAP